MLTTIKFSIQLQNIPCYATQSFTTVITKARY